MKKKSELLEQTVRSSLFLMFNDILESIFFDEKQISSTSKQYFLFYQAVWQIAYFISRKKNIRDVPTQDFYMRKKWKIFESQEFLGAKIAKQGQFTVFKLNTPKNMFCEYSAFLLWFFCMIFGELVYFGAFLQLWG